MAIRPIVLWMIQRQVWRAFWEAYDSDRQYTQLAWMSGGTLYIVTGKGHRKVQRKT